MGETCRKLKDWVNQHRSDINCKKNTVIATDFSQKCPDINFFQITPIEKVLCLVQESYTFMVMMENSDTVGLYQREQAWTRRLKPLNPQGLNRKEELPPPIAFCMSFNDQAYEIAKLVKTTYLRIQERLLSKSQIVSAYKRNRNLNSLSLTHSHPLSHLCVT
jgi:hypothetical protein